MVKKKKMEVWKLYDKEFNPDSKSQWEKIDMEVEVAIRKYAGKKTLKLIWEEQEGILSSTIIKSHIDTESYNKRIGNYVLAGIKELFNR